MQHRGNVFVVDNQVGEPVSMVTFASMPKADMEPHVVCPVGAAAPMEEEEPAAERFDLPDDVVSLEEVHEHVNAWTETENGYPVMVTMNPTTFVVPYPRHAGHQWPYRSSWIVHGAGWKQLESHVEYRVAPGDDGIILRDMPAKLITRFEPRDMDVEGSGIDESDVQPAGVAVPGQPTAREREQHELSHLPFQPWCDLCVRARAADPAHRRRSHEERERSNVVQIDYDFLTSNFDATDSEDARITFLCGVVGGDGQHLLDGGPEERCRRRVRGARLGQVDRHRHRQLRRGVHPDRRRALDPGVGEQGRQPDDQADAHADGGGGEPRQPGQR